MTDVVIKMRNVSAMEKTIAFVHVHSNVFRKPSVCCLRCASRALVLANRGVVATSTWLMPASSPWAGRL